MTGGLGRQAPRPAVRGSALCNRPPERRKGIRHQCQCWVYPYQDGSANWVENYPDKVGSGWGFRHVFVKESDPGRETIITTQLFDIPTCPPFRRPSNRLLQAPAPARYSSHNALYASNVDRRRGPASRREGSRSDRDDICD